MTSIEISELCSKWAFTRSPGPDWSWLSRMSGQALRISVTIMCRIWSAKIRSVSCRLACLVRTVLLVERVCISPDLQQFGYCFIVKGERIFPKIKRHHDFKTSAWCSLKLKMVRKSAESAIRSIARVRIAQSQNASFGLRSDCVPGSNASLNISARSATGASSNPSSKVATKASAASLSSSWWSSTYSSGKSIG